MRIIIFGASGLIGQALVNVLSDSYCLTLVGRDINKLKKIFFNQKNFISLEEIDNQEDNFFESFDIIINLAGENISAKRWSKKQKEEIINSRTQMTTFLARRCARLIKKPRILNASAIGIYGLKKTITQQNNFFFDEDSSIEPPRDFLSQVGVAWEHALWEAEKNGVSIVKMRFAVVLSSQGGALAKLLPSYKMGLGAVLGSGNQPVSWVALDDVVRGIVFLIDHPEITGPVNVAAPEILSQKQFAKKLASKLNKPQFLRLPKFLIHLLFGQMGDELLSNGQKVKSKRLMEYGFQFKYDKLDKFFNHLFKE